MNQAVAPVGTGARVSARRFRGGGHSQLGSTWVLCGVWVALIVGTSIAKPAFFGEDTFTALSYSAVVLLPLCVGFGVVTMSGSGLDLSSGVVASISAMFCAQLMTAGHSSGETILIILALGAAIGMVNGCLIAGLGLDPVVTTLGTNFVGIGLVRLQSIVLSMPADSVMRSVAFGRPLGVTNLFFIAIALVVAVEVFLRGTSRGRHVVALGGNPVAAVRQGISQVRIRFLVFVFSGMCAALGGLMFAASSDQVRGGQAGFARAFQATSAVLLAGIMLTGGRGRLVALIPAVLVIVTIQTAATTLGVVGAWATIIQGTVLGVALGIDGFRAHRRNTR